MRFTQYYLECLSQASYLIADETTGVAAVVDPRRDVQTYLDDAAADGCRIRYVIETHLHADFLSGHLELAAACGATVIYGAAADVRFDHRKVVDGERLSLGRVVLEFRATPGHTPESICVVVWEDLRAGAPYGVLTGDTLFVGDVGRPDLGTLGGRSAEDMARQLHASLHAKLLALPDETRVYPAHGAGSACGKSMSAETTSTIGRERRTNSALRTSTVEEFVGAVTGGRAPPPDYFAHVAALNREVHHLLRDEEVSRLSLAEVVRRQDDGAVVLDVRSPEAFAQGHLRRSLNVGLEGRFAEHAAEVIDGGSDIVVVCPPGTEQHVRVRLSRVGLDSVLGVLDHAELALAHRPALVDTATRVTGRQLARAVDVVADLVLLDVRTAAERASGAIASSRHIPLAELRRRVGELERHRPLVVYCGGGYRSSIAASFLRMSGFADVSDLIGGYQAWRAYLDRPVTGLDPDAACRGAIADGLVVHRADPLNAETPLAALAGGVVTPNAQFYVRNHFQIPNLDPATWRLDVVGGVEHPLTLSLSELQAMPARTVVVTLECAGNGRTQLEPAVPGEPWRLGAVSTAEWTGVPLMEVLDRAGLEPAARHVVFHGADSGAVVGRAGVTHFERSLDVDQIRGTGPLLAFAMNGEPLPRRHGYPLRLIVPTWYAVASVKWLTRIEVTDEPFSGYYQVDRYQYERPQDGHVEREPVTLQQVRSLVVEPSAGQEVASGEVTIRGVAWSGAAPIARIEVSIGGGAWQQATIVGEGQRGRWQWWELAARVETAGPVTVRAKATDLAGRTQPDHPPWNRQGYGSNAVHAALITVVPER